MKKMIKRVVTGVVISGIIIGSLVMNKMNNSKADGTYTKDSEQTRRTSIQVDDNGKLQVTRDPLGDVSMGKDNTWTLFVYMCGSDLETEDNCASVDIKEMISAGESDNVNIVIQTGGSKSWSKPAIESDKIGRYVIENNQLKLIESHPDASMGDYATLKSFLKWGIKKYPAENMGVIFWNHGGGPVEGVCYNEKYDYDSLSMAEIEMALESTSKNMTDKFQVIGFDACLMSSTEVANMLVPYADYMVASQQSEPCDGWEYKSVVNALVDNSDIKGDAFGKAIVDGFIKCITENEYDDDEYSTLSVTDLSKVDDTIVAFNDVAKNMNEVALNSTVLKQFRQAAIDSTEVGSGDSEFGLVDLHDYMGRISNIVSGTENVQKAIENMTVYEKHASESPNAHGITFYYPIAETGFYNLNKLRNILPSPFYASYIDKVEHYYTFLYNDMKAQGIDYLYVEVYGDNYLASYVESEYNLEDYVDNKWESSPYYYEKTFGYTEYEFESVKQYKELRELPYFQQVSFDDNWFNMYFGNE